MVLAAYPAGLCSPCTGAPAAAERACLVLEPTYTGKTLAVLLSERAKNALFVNTYAAPPTPDPAARRTGSP